MTVKRVRANSHASTVGVQVDWVALKVALTQVETKEDQNFETSIILSLIHWNRLPVLFFRVERTCLKSRTPRNPIGLATFLHPTHLLPRFADAMKVIQTHVPNSVTFCCYS